MDRVTEIKNAGLRIGINTTGELLDPRFDYVFRRIFTAQEKESKIALIDFLNSILFKGEDIVKDLTVLDNEIPVESYKQKKSRFDIRIIFENGEQANVEMELRAKDNFIKRSLHNGSRLYSSQPINRLNYRKLKKCYIIGIMGYNVLRKFDYLETFMFRNETGRLLSDDIQITFLQLEKIEGLLEKPVDELTNAECWAIFLRYASFNDKYDVLEKISKKNGGVKMAVDVLKYISKSDIERMRYEDEILAEIDQEEEIETAVNEERRKFAKKMIVKNKPIDEIIEFTELTEEEIEELKEDI